MTDRWLAYDCRPLSPPELQAQQALRLLRAEVAGRPGHAGARGGLQQQGDAVALADVRPAVLGHPAPPRLARLPEVQAAGGQAAGHGQGRRGRGRLPLAGAPGKRGAAVLLPGPQGQGGHLHAVLLRGLRRRQHVEDKHVAADEAEEGLGGLAVLRGQREGLGDLVAELLPAEDQPPRALGGRAHGAVQRGGGGRRGGAELLGAERGPLAALGGGKVAHQLQPQRPLGLICPDGGAARGVAPKRRLQPRDLQGPRAGQRSGRAALLALQRVDGDGEVQLGHEPRQLRRGLADDGELVLREPEQAGAQAAELAAQDLQALVQRPRALQQAPLQRGEHRLRGLAVLQLPLLRPAAVLRDDPVALLQLPRELGEDLV
mmetsp:Transcript_52781/g.160052  ORF Transcript_52781/g.160052 Transcript_52781/m.160052 type:complete len:374 (-) Transcript_52781:247-1368(-)